ncbi:MAG: acyl-CoA dehydrogenase, partial [Pseudomonadota bacterium]
MDFSLNEEQKLLQETVDRFVEKEYSFEARKKLVATEAGWSRDNWARFAELGWLGICFPEDQGGLGGSMVEAAVIMESFGKGIVTEPYLQTVVLGGGLLSLDENGAGRAFIPDLVAGALQVSFGYVERQSRYNLANVETKAEKTGGGYVLTGRKGVVFNAQTADKLIVSARTAGSSRDRKGITLFLLDAGAKGVSLRPYGTVDGLRGAEVALDGVTLGPEAVLGGVDNGLPLIEHIVDRAIVAVCAEAAGIMEVLVGKTQEYLKTRTQFGVTLSKFQVLQHRMADMFIAHEMAKSMAYMAAVRVSSEDAVGRRRATSAAKAKIGESGRL